MLGHDQERVFMDQEKYRHVQIDLQYYLTQRVTNLEIKQIGIILFWMKVEYQILYLPEFCQ